MKELLESLTPMEKEKIPLFMETGHGYSTRLEVHFTKKHPYQLIDTDEVMELINTGRFRLASAEEIKRFYRIEEESSV